MTRRGTVIRGYAACASLLLLLPVVPAVAAAASEETPCPGADAWREAHSQELPAALAQRDQARTFSAPDLRTDLERRFEADQRERRQLLANRQDRGARDRVRWA